MRLPVLLLLAIALAPPPSLAQELTGADYYRLLQRADSLQRAADLPGLEPVVRRLLAYEDRDGEQWLRLARALDAQRKWREALDAYQRVVQVGFDYTPDHWYAIARLHAQLGARDSALTYLRQALAARFVGRYRLRTDTAFIALRTDPEFVRLAGIPPTQLTRDQRWQFDLDYLVEEARRLHGAPERLAYQPRFDSTAAALRRDIPRLDDETIVARLRELIVLLDDGHSGVYFGYVARVPVGMHWFKDGVFITRDFTGDIEPAVPGDTTLLGSQVLAVNDVPVLAALRRVAPYVSRDNEMGVRAIAPAYLGYRGIVRAAGISADTTALRLTVRTRRGTERKVTLPFVDSNSLSSRAGTLPGDTSTLPLYLRRPRTPYWMMAMPEAAAVYLQFNSVRNNPELPIPQFAKQLTALLDSTRARNLIVDLRHNGGGNSYLFPPFIRAMIVFREKSPEHRVFVITSRNTFSAAQNFATAVDQWVGATFVGEPSGSRAIFVGETSPFLLPATGTRANISWRWHQYAQWVDHRKWLAPRIPAEMTSADWLARRDPALDAIVRVIKGN